MSAISTARAGDPLLTIALPSAECASPSASEANIAHALARLSDPLIPMWRYRHARQDAFSRLMLLSVSDGYERARVATVQLDPDALHAGRWAALLPVVEKALARLAGKFNHPLLWCRLEWPFAVREWQWQPLQDEIQRYKRNYFRSGLAFRGKDTSLLLLGEMELNANACLYPGGRIAHARVNQPRLEGYIRARHGSSRMPSFAEEMPAWSFSTEGVFLEVSEAEVRVHALETRPRQWGRRQMPALTTQASAALIASGTRFLSHQIGPRGRYVYGYFPCFDRRIDSYNVLRHASSTYALLEGYEACREQQLLSAGELSRVEARIRLALEDLRLHFVVHREGAAYVAESDNSIKLGANAVTILALVKFHQVMADGQYDALADALALGITRMQASDGSFVHVIDAADLSVKEKNRIIYYDGEAAFALMRLYGRTRDSRWLDCVVRAFDYFIANGHEKAHDHWLAYCTNELVRYRPERRYFAFAVRNVAGYIDFIHQRITTFPTLLELSMAFHCTLERLKAFPAFSDLLDDFDVAAFYQALHARAYHLMNGFFWPEMAMFFKSPATITGGFFIRHHAFRVRIDDVEHYLSGLIAYQKMLREDGATVVKPLSAGLDARTLAAVTGGTWLSSPSKKWQANGICGWLGSFQPGQVVVARSKTMDKGFLPFAIVKTLVARGAAAVICDDGDPYRDIGVPVLEVRNARSAILAIAARQRHGYAGRVIGVTGSAGKTTTVTMLAHALAYNGEVGRTVGSANLPTGIALNISSMPQQAIYWVVEMAIGSMGRSTELVRPDIAIVTNIDAAHLLYHSSLDEIARKKARIFDGMSPGGLVVLYRDMPYYSYFAEQAARRCLRVVSFGEHTNADLRLLDYTGSRGSVVFDGKVHDLVMEAPGRHMMLNAMSVLAVARYDNLPLGTVIDRLTSFRAVSGRGERRSIIYKGIPINLIDEAYNANPLSMRMALETYDAQPVDPSQKLVIVGDMLELGDAAEKFHIELAPLLESMSVRKVLLCGEHCRVLAQQLNGESASVFYFEDVKALSKSLIRYLKPHDSVLIKASHGVGLHALFSE
ncbi:UDP-N-acetylmuramoyl-tripeptide--D-alanyl-D-alanine ligase [Kushneria aurantia]|uniref:UDP-N-acetylmuramoyl-tripeptide--D-alanyl-D-alanine ligase n=1 Tax=Kushneria aurantia TaxID=504092 RepID=A0ABV6G6K1_9GAMM|nr:UDP-N-acetylmuramoyl-tripeptide--D-alanyl-D-alanine ligase [Kushneria aurantia]